jgi:hypothetical protein
MPMRSLTVVAALAALSGAAVALPSFSAPELQARANFTGAYNLPNAAFFTNSTPDINALGAVAFRVAVIAGTESDGMWFGSNGAGSILYFSPNIEDSRLGDPSISDSNELITDQSFATPSGVIRIGVDSGQATVVINPGFPFGVEAFSAVQVNNSGQIGFRGRVGFLGNIFVSWSNGQQVAHAAEIGVDPNSPYSFLFTPGFNNARQIAAKVRLAPGQGNERPDQIRIFNSDGSSILVAEDRDSNPASPYSGFDNSCALTSDGRVAFIASLVGGGRGVFLSDGTTTTTIALTTSGQPSSIESFRPDVNDDGLVVFRAFNAQGKRAVFVGDGVDLVEVATQDDIVEIDLGLAQISENNPGDPSFGGSPSINANGDVVFAAALIPPGNPAVEYGSGIFVVYATTDIPGDTNGDGIVNFTDLNNVLGQFGQSGEGLSGDVNGDGVVNFADLNIVLANFGKGR